MLAIVFVGEHFVGRVVSWGNFFFGSEAEGLRESKSTGPGGGENRLWSGSTEAKATAWPIYVGDLCIMRAATMKTECRPLAMLKIDGIVRNNKGSYHRH